MNLPNSKSHIIKHVSAVSTIGVVFRLAISITGIAGYIIFNDFFFNLDNLWLYVPVNLLFIGLWIFWPIFDLMNWNKVECDTHDQKIIYKSLLKGTVVLPFDALFKIKVWTGKQDTEPNQQANEEDIMQIPTTVSKIEFVGKEGQLISVEGTSMFNQVIRNYLDNVPVEVVDN